MNWKRRAALAEKEAAYIAANGDSNKQEDVFEGPFALQPKPDDAREITFEELMEMILPAEDENNKVDPAELKKAEKSLLKV